MGNKAKGSNRERELIKMFHGAGWAPVRVAGSGSAPIPCPDIVAANGTRRIAVECKSTRKSQLYVPFDKVEQLSLFCRVFGAEAWLGVRFDRQEWQFYNPQELPKTEKNYIVSQNDTSKSSSFTQLIETKQP